VWRRIAFAAAALGLVAGCASAVSGSGHLADGVSPPGGTDTITIGVPPATPSPSGSTSSSSAPPPNPLACPNVSYAPGRLAFPCLTRGMTVVRGDPVWDLTLDQEVEPTWVLAEGAKKLAALKGRSLADVALGLRKAMLANTQYGDSPVVHTESASSTTVAGVPAYVLQTAFTIDAQYRVQNNLRVRVEKLWIVTLSAGDGQVAAWYVTVPDDVSNLWPKVPALIKSIGLI
jgi:hypothetical protein